MTTRPRPRTDRLAGPRRRQQGAASLIITIIVVVLITLLAVKGNRAALVEQRTATNKYWYTAAFQSAQGALEYTIAWLATTGNAKGAAWNAAWVSDTSHPPYDQRNTTSIASRAFGPYTATVVLRRHSSRPALVEIEATGVSADATTATVKQIVNVAGALDFNIASAAPLIVNGCIGGITGTPDIVGTDAGGSSLVAAGSAACVDTGHLNYSGVARTDAFVSSAWSHVFKSSKADAKTAAQSQPGGPTGGPIYYYDDATVASYTPSNLGTSTEPVVLIFDISSGECPKINGGRTIYGIVYCGQGLDMQGWGGTTIHGSLIVETSITKYSANTVLAADAVASDTRSYDTPMVVSKVAGTWRDF